MGTNGAPITRSARTSKSHRQAESVFGAPAVGSNCARPAGVNSPVTIRLGHRKRVRQMPDFMYFAVGQEHLNDVESDFYRRIFQQPQIIQRGLRKQPPLARVDRRRRACPLLGRPRFDLDERQTIIVAKDQINLAALGTEIGREKFQSLPLQMTFGRALAQFAVAQVLRLFLAGEPVFQFFQQIHSVEKNPLPLSPRHPLPAGAGRGVVVSSLWLDSIRPQAERYRLFPLSAKRGEGRGGGDFFVYPRSKGFAV